MPTTSAALLERLPGTPAGQVDGLSVAAARRRGAACAALHDRLAIIAAPSVVPDVAGFGDQRNRGLLHLDLHPFNVLLDDADQVSAVLDWANAAAGDPQLDRARTLTILTLDPAALRRRQDPRWVALADTWIEAAQLRDTDRRARRWACRYMLADLGNRYEPQDVAHIHETLARWSSPPSA